MKMKLSVILKIFFIYTFILSASGFSYGFMGTIDSGELVPINQYRIILEPQLSPFNLDAHFDAGVTDSSQLRLSLGAGESGTHFDFFYKTIPYPNFDNQPAMGYKIGTIFASEKGGINSLTIRFTPLLSKTYKVQGNLWTPYLALPLGVSVRKSTSTTPTHFAVGTEFTPTSSPDMQFGLEAAANLRDSFSYISAFISFYFEPTETDSDIK